MTADGDRLELLLTVRRWAEAEAFARECIARDPEWADGYTYLARALLGKGDHPAAVEAAKTGVGKNPHAAWPHAVLGSAEMADRKYRKAEQAFREALRLHPQYAWVYEQLARLYYRQSDFRAAHQAAVDGLAHAPSDPGLLAQKGWAEYRLGRRLLAQETAEAGLRTDPTAAELHNLSGNVEWAAAGEGFTPWRRARHYRRAVAAFREAVRLDPSEPVYHANLEGVVLAFRRLALAAAGITLTVGMFGCIAGGGALAEAGNPTGQAVLIGVGLGCVFAALLFGAARYSRRLTLAAPLGWCRLPTLPMSANRLRWGRRVWVGLVAAPVVFVGLTVSVALTRDPLPVPGQPPGRVVRRPADRDRTAETVAGKVAVTAVLIAVVYALRGRR